MERIKCPYCNYYYNKDLKAPMSLECGHVICKSCINELKIYMITCPFDNQRVNYTKSQTNDAIIKNLSSLCKLHYLPITSTCKSHLEQLCSSCDFGHRDCDISKDSMEKVDYEVEIGYIDMSISAINLQKKNQSLHILEISEALDIQTTKFKEIQIFCNKLLTAENDKSYKIDLLKYEEFINRKSIEDVKFVHEALSNSLKEVPEFNPLDFHNFLKTIGIYQNNINTEFKKIKKKGNALTYLCLNQIHSSTNGYIKHMATYSQISFDIYVLNFLGIGGPVKIGDTLLILNLELRIDEILVWKNQNIMLRGKKSKMIHIINTPKIVLKKNSELFIEIELQDVDRFIFTEPVIDDVVRMIIYDDNLLFPIPIFGYLNEN